MTGEMRNELLSFLSNDQNLEISLRPTERKPVRRWKSYVISGLYLAAPAISLAIVLVWTGIVPISRLQMSKADEAASAELADGSPDQSPSALRIARNTRPGAESPPGVESERPAPATPPTTVIGPALKARPSDRDDAKPANRPAMTAPAPEPGFAFEPDQKAEDRKDEAPPNGGDDDPIRAELDKRIRIYENDVARLRDEMRKALESDLGAAKKNKDQTTAKRVQAELDAYAKDGRMPATASTSTLRKKLQQEQTRLQVSYERAEAAYRAAGNPNLAAMVVKERDAFLEKADDSEEGRFLRSQGLQRRGSYYVLRDTEAASFSKYTETNNRYKLAAETVELAVAIHQNDLAMEQCWVAMANVVEAIRLLDLEIRSGHLKKPQLAAANERQTLQKATLIDLQKQWAVLWGRLPSLRKRDEVKAELIERVALLRDNVKELRVVVNQVRKKYEEVRTPAVREALSRLHLALGPSDNHQQIQKKLAFTEKELKAMNIDMRPIRTYTREPQL